MRPETLNFVVCSGNLQEFLEYCRFLTWKIGLPFFFMYIRWRDLNCQVLTQVPVGI